MTKPNQQHYPNDKLQPPIMAGKPIPEEWRVDLVNWDTPPYNRWSFVNCNEILPTATIVRDEKNVLFFPENLQDLESITFTRHRGEVVNLHDYLHQGFIDAYIVYHRGKIIFEKYFAFTTRQHCHLLQSCTKSVVGAVAQKLKDEKLLSGDMLIEKILPELKNTGYGGATVQQALDMTTGIDFEETYGMTEVLSGDCLGLDVANGWKPRSLYNNPPLDNFSFIQRFTKQQFPHGQKMIYRCLETEVITHCLEKITGKKIADLISEFFWRPMGAEGNAFITVDAAGYGIGSGGMCVRARDILKFGVMMAEGGVVNGKQLLPAVWVDECYDPAPYKFNKKHPELEPCGGYKNFFWIRDLEPQVIMCSGVFGQKVMIDKTNDVVIVEFATNPTYLDDDRWYDSVLLSKSIAEAIAR